MRFDVPPSEAIDYFRRKKVLPSKEFYAIQGEAKSAAFTVSGIYKQDVLEAFRQEIENALANGSSRQSLVKRFKDILAGAGHKELGDFHLETVARTNLMMAYGVGRRRQMEESSGLLPFWQYNAVGDDRTRPTHRALDGIVLPADNPFWDTRKKTKKPAAPSNLKAERNDLIAKVHICWKKMRPELAEKSDVSREKRLLWIQNLLKLENLSSITKLTDKQLTVVSETMKLILQS